MGHTLFELFLTYNEFYLQKKLVFFCQLCEFFQSSILKEHFQAIRCEITSSQSFNTTNCFKNLKIFLKETIIVLYKYYIKRLKKKSKESFITIKCYFK